MTSYPLLDTIGSPAALRALERKQLPQLAEDRDWNTAGMQVVTYSIEPDTGR